MSSYYFLSCYLPPLNFPALPDMSLAELKDVIRLNLSAKDHKVVDKLRLFIDISNIRPLLSEEEIDPRGNLSEKELDEAILAQTMLPDFVFDYFDKYQSLADRLKHFSELLVRFFQNAAQEDNEFLKKYFTFERQWRLILVALRAKAAGKDVVRELLFEDFSDPFVMHILAQKDATIYDPPADFDVLKDLFNKYFHDPLQLQKVISEYRFYKILELKPSSAFSLDAILAYLAQLQILEYLSELDVDRGCALLETFKTT